ncbi:MAG: hypothetical protein ABSB33_03320 [Tepidisphaeraceae bacterium]
MALNSTATGKRASKRNSASAATVAAIGACEQPAIDTQSNAPKTPAGPSEFRLTLRALPVAPGGPPAIIRLRGALKVLLRRFSLRCVDVRELPSGYPVDGTPPAESGPGDLSSDGPIAALRSTGEDFAWEQ